jgi:diguanylate cyclase (GGDEF)-like protein
MGVSPTLSDPVELVALGAFVGAQVLVVLLSVVRANAYRERPLLLHAAATLLGVLTLQTLTGTHPFYPEAVLLFTLAVAGLQLRDLMSQVGAVAQARQWLLVVCVVLPMLAIATAFAKWLLLPSVALWVAVVLLMLHRAWPLSQPWIWWLVPGTGALVSAGGVLAARAITQPDNLALAVGTLLTVWTACTYLATGWRGRILGETAARIDARNTVDPLTGLSTPIVLTERVQAARTLMRRYGHPSVLMLVHIENLGRISQEFGPEVAETAVLTAANRIRQALREGDVAARLAHSRIAVLAEGMAPAEAAANVASRILVAGLKEPLPAAPAEFLQFRIVLATVPVAELSPKHLLARMAARMDQELHETSQRRIVTLAGEEPPTMPAPV